MTESSLLLDSHVWIWTVSGDANLGRKAKAVIRGGAQRNAVAISGISFWELAVKAAKGKLELRPDTREWLRNASRLPGLGVIDVDRELMFRATLLEWSHGDPADRVLVATAIFHDLQFVTADRVILDYAKSNRTFRVIDATR